MRSIGFYCQKTTLRPKGTAHGYIRGEPYTRQPAIRSRKDGDIQTAGGAFRNTNKADRRTDERDRQTGKLGKRTRPDAGQASVRRRKGIQGRSAGAGEWRRRT